MNKSSELLEMVSTTNVVALKKLIQSETPECYILVIKEVLKLIKHLEPLEAFELACEKYDYPAGTELDVVNQSREEMAQILDKYFNIKIPLPKNKLSIYKPKGKIVAKPAPEPTWAATEEPTEDEEPLEDEEAVESLSKKLLKGIRNG